MQAYGGNGCVNPHFLDLGTSWMWVVTFTPLPLYPLGESLRYLWIGGRVGPTAGLDGVEKRKFMILPGIELGPLGRQARSQLLYRLRYPDYAIPTPHVIIIINSFFFKPRNILFKFLRLNFLLLFCSHTLLKKGFMSTVLSACISRVLV
jgi:hypothetical protein